MERVRATPKYEHIADRIAWQIDRGVFEPGERLPSIRELSDQLAVSLNTVRESYRLLESRGLVEAVSQSGHYVRQGPPICLDPLLDHTVSRDGHAVLDVGESEWIDRVQRDAAQEGVIYLSTAEPPVSLLPARSIARAISHVVRDRPERSLRYGPSEGPLELRQEIAKRMFRAGVDVSPDEVVVTAGCIEAIGIALRSVATPGDAVVIESPAFYLFFPLLRSLGLRAVEVPSLCAEGVDPSALDHAIDAAERAGARVVAALLTGNFTNPIGALVSDESKRRIAEILAHRGVTLVEDDIYGELHFGRRRPTALTAFADPAASCYCSSFSKTVSPGLRVGWVVARGRLLTEVRRSRLVSSFATSPANCLAMAEFLARGDFDRVLRRARVRYERNAALAREAVARWFPAGTTATRPEGGLVFWVALPARFDTRRVYERALREGIVFAPGSIFTLRDGYASHMRMSAVRFDAEVERAIRRLGELLQEGG